MMKRHFYFPLSLLTIISLSIGALNAQSNQKDFIVVQRDNSNQSIKFLRVHDNMTANANDHGISWLNQAFGLNEEASWKLLNVEHDKLGYTHYRLQQTFKGYPIEGTMYIVHTKDGFIQSANGEYATRLNINTQVSVAESSALQTAVSRIGADLYKWQIPKEEAHLKLEQNDANATYLPKSELVIAKKSNDDAYRLCHRFDIYAHAPLSRNYVYIDAQTGSLIKKASRIFHADSLVSGQSKYSGVLPFTADYTGANFRLRESARGNGVETYNLQNTTDYSTAIDFTHSDALWDTLPNNDTLAIDVHIGAEATYDYMLNTHSRNSIDGNGMTLLNYVHYDVNFANAFWDGQRMTYGDGDASIDALVSPDICGHEIGHGLQQFTAGFSQQGEAGSLAESFSDILGLLVEASLFPGRSDIEIYNTGDQPGNTPDGIRNFINPSLTSHPDTYGGSNWDNSGFDIHGNGVVHDHWFYILAEGKTGTNDNNDAFTVNSIGRNKAGDIAWRSLTTYLTPNSTFADARTYAIQSAIDLYGPCSNELVETTNAWYAVGVGAEYSATLEADFEFNINICTNPVSVDFINKSTGASSFEWSFGDGASSNDFQASHAYGTDGKYTVKLVATSCNLMDKDSLILVDEIIINNGLDCDSADVPLTGSATSNNCYGWAYDHGGANDGAVLNTNGTLTISPANTEKIAIKFTSFQYDFIGTVTLYDGADQSSPVLGSYSAFQPPTLDSIINTTGPHLTISEVVNSGGFPIPPGFPIGSGFSAFWECKAKPAVGIEEEFTDNSFLVYPNPTMDILNVKSNRSLNIDKIKIFDAVGTLIQYQDISIEGSGENKISINLQSKPTGIYYLMIESEGKVYREKFIRLKE